MKSYMQWMLTSRRAYSRSTKRASSFYARLIVALAAILIISGSTVLTSCSDDEVTETGTGTGWTEPATDQMDVTVTYPLTAASLSQFAEPSTGAALIRRLPKVTAAITDDTRMVLLKGSDAGSLSYGEIAAMVDVLANNGYLAIETPTEKQLDTFLDQLDKAIAEYVASYVNDEFELTSEQMQATLSASMAGRMQTRRANLAAYTRAAAADRPCTELLIFGPTGYFFLEADNSDDMIVTYATDTEGNIVEEPYETACNAGEMTAYRYGLYADGAAGWLNGTEAAMEAADEQQTRGGAPRRASGAKAINDLESACETFTHYQNINYKTSGNKASYKVKACQTTLSYWGVHSTTNHRDYYYVSQKVLLSLGADNGVDIFYARDKAADVWTVVSQFGKYNLMYGSYLTKYETSMNLKGDKGYIKGEAATPETANQTITESVNLTTSSSSTSGQSKVLGATLGGSLAGFTGHVTGGRVWNSGKTTGSSFAMGNSKSIKDLNVVKNSLGTMVKWTYSGKDLQVTGQPNKWQHETMPPILVNDANLANDACWSVENPSGNYTLEVQSQPEVGMLLVQNSSTDKIIQRTKTPIDTYTHELRKPNRYLQTWRMFIVIDEWLEGAHYTAGVQKRLEEDFKNSFSDIYNDVFTVCESEENSVLLATGIIKNAKRVLDAHKDQLPGIAEGRGVKQFTIYWRCDNTDVRLRNAYVVKVE